MFFLVRRSKVIKKRGRQIKLPKHTKNCAKTYAKNQTKRLRATTFAFTKTEE
jgi:hypothetical protein